MRTNAQKHHTFFLASTLLVLVVLGCGDISTDQDWKRELAGKKLSTAKTSGSFSDSQHVYFCTSGEYIATSQTSGFSTGGAGTLSTASEDAEYGKWNVSSSTLTLQPKNGSRYEVQLSKGTGDDVIRMNGVVYLVSTHNDNCEEE